SLPGLEIVRYEHTTFDTQPRGVRRDAVGEVARRRAREHVEPELQRSRRCNGNDAILVRERRMVYRVVLDVQLADANPVRQPTGAHERREPRVEAGARLTGNGQQLAIPPQVLRSPFDDLARKPDRRIVVDRLERSETVIADVKSLGGKC